MFTELAKTYDPAGTEPRVTERWLAAKAFAAAPDARTQRYVIMMPLPNVTGALHMGHAMDNVMQDLLIRWHRMQGDNTLWQAGTDHAGIATQAVVEKRLKELEGKTRHDVGREGLVARIWEWKEVCQKRIVRQQQAMGCSADWDRTRFTMDPVCARAVRHVFFRMFREGLVYQGDRMVNWDCALQTAVSDDELYKATVQGAFWYLRYPVIDPRPGEPTHVVVATTRPETMLGDTAIACHPEPAAAARASGVEVPAERIALLETIARMARDGRRVRLPLAGRELPILLDEWARPEMGSGCVKITPAHDPNDYDVWQRHRDRIGALVVLNPDGTMNAAAGRFAGLDRFAARQQVVAALATEGLVERIEERAIEVDHSDRSKTVIEPLLSRQWFVHMGDVPGGITMGRGTGREFRSPGLAAAAIDAARPGWRSPGGRNVTFHPDPERYAKVYTAWLAEKRDWCISRQLWWGHRIPVWSGSFTGTQLLALAPILREQERRDDAAAWVTFTGGRRATPGQALDALERGEEAREGRALVNLCFRDERAENAVAPLLRSAGLAPDPDVLDTWFSSAIWPFSTLGWPDPATAQIDPGQSPLASRDGHPDALAYYYPGSCLVTGRDIITLWVARMTLMGLYVLGDVPFTDVFLHANIQDGKGERMSKSKGNGVDPIDIIERYGADAMRYVLCEMQTGTQDIRLPVQVLSPFGGEVLELAALAPGSTVGTYRDPKTGREFDVAGNRTDLPTAKTFSERFDVGRGFCNKLWNAARFALMNLEGTGFTPLDCAALPGEDRWILSRLARSAAEAQRALQEYNPSAALGALREFFWSELCDWYLELIKPRMRDAGRAPVARQVLAATLDQTLRLLHPFVPFVTEALWERLREVAPKRGITEEFADSELLVRAAWPRPEAAWRDTGLEERFALLHEVCTAAREIRARYALAPGAKVAATLRASGASAAALHSLADALRHMAGLEPLQIAAEFAKPKDAATAVVRDTELFVLGVVDVDKERGKLGKELEQLLGRIRGTEGKLANPGFLAKAQPEVIERERGLLAELHSRAEAVRRALAGL
ncbi:MAG: valine--tRNA ligase [Planctomycetes bacterium]|nr:valine--tRNA ligase [Planctomycetota bacterium]